MRDLHNNLKVSKVISPQSVADNTALVGTIIDTQGFDSLEFLLLWGSLGDAAATFAVLVEHGEDSSLTDAAAVADGELLGTEAQAKADQADDDKVSKIGYLGNKRYVRLTITPADNATAALIGACAIQGHAHALKVADQSLSGA